MKAKIILILILSLCVNLSATNPKELAKKLSLNPASKAIIQWDRVFKSKRKMKRYKIDTLTDEEKKVLKIYLQNHAADSDKPQFAGDL